MADEFLARFQAPSRHWVTAFLASRRNSPSGMAWYTAPVKKSSRASWPATPLHPFYRFRKGFSQEKSFGIGDPFLSERSTFASFGTQVQSSCDETRRSYERMAVSNKNPGVLALSSVQHPLLVCSVPIKLTVLGFFVIIHVVVVKPVWRGLRPCSSLRLQLTALTRLLIGHDGEALKSPHAVRVATARSSSTGSPFQ
jgi:hypothetical protein